MAASDPSLCKTPLGETECLGKPYFTHWLPRQPVFDSPSTLTQSVRLPMVTYPHYAVLCGLRVAMPHHWSLDTFRPSLYLGGAEDFPGGDNHSGHVPLPTYLA